MTAIIANCSGTARVSRQLPPLIERRARSNFSLSPPVFILSATTHIGHIIKTSPRAPAVMQRAYCSSFSLLLRTLYTCLSSLRKRLFRVRAGPEARARPSASHTTHICQTHTHFLAKAESFPPPPLAIISPCHHDAVKRTALICLGGTVKAKRENRKAGRFQRHLIAHQLYNGRRSLAILFRHSMQCEIRRSLACLLRAPFRSARASNYI